VAVVLLVDNIVAHKLAIQWKNNKYRKSLVNLPYDYGNRAP
jgi:hypothetical protein